MPSVSIQDQKKFIEGELFSAPYCAAGEPAGEPAAPTPSVWHGRSGLSEEEVEHALERSRLRTALGDLSERERSRLAETLLEQPVEGRGGELPDELNERLLDAMVD